MKYSWIAIIFVFFLISCSSDSSSPSGPKTPTSILIPLKTGNVWNYRQYHYGNNGQRDDSAIVALTISKVTTIAGVHWYSPNPSYWETNKSDGLWEKDNQNHDFLFFRYPYSNLAVYAVAANINCQLETTHDTVTVPYGTISCYVYHVTVRPPYGNQSISREYIKPDLGIVKQEDYDSYGFLAYSYELISCTLH